MLITKTSYRFYFGPLKLWSCCTLLAGSPHTSPLRTKRNFLHRELSGSALSTPAHASPASTSAVTPQQGLAGLTPKGSANSPAREYGA